MMLYNKKEWEKMKKEQKYPETKECSYEDELNTFISHLNTCVDDNTSLWTHTYVKVKKSQP